MQRVLVTGATGFIGQSLVRRLLKEGHVVRAAGRSSSPKLDGIQFIDLGDFSDHPNWQSVVEGMDVVIHLAARVHVMGHDPDDALKAFRKVNTIATRELATAAATANVGRFIYLSSVKVHGECTSGEPFRESDILLPQGAYAQSKHEAEIALSAIGKSSGMETVIIRPPLVYGPGVGANFLTLLKVIGAGLPLPFGSIKNRRSLIGLDNLVDFIYRCCHHPAAANEAFLVSDGEDLSTPKLIKLLSTAFGKNTRIFPWPIPTLVPLAWAVGKADRLPRLVDSLQVSSDKAHALLDWQPPVSISAGFDQVVSWYKSRSV